VRTHKDFFRKPSTLSFFRRGAKGRGGDEYTGGANG